MDIDDLKEEYKLAPEEFKLSILKSFLASQESPVGDWKIIKIYEARLKGEDDPYDFDELNAARQEIRDEINRVQALQDDGDE